MQIGCLQVMVMVVRVMLVVVVVMVVVHPEDKDADSVYHQPEYSNENGLVEDDIYRVEKPVKALPCHQQREQGQQDGADESAKALMLRAAACDAMCRPSANNAIDP